MCPLLQVLACLSLFLPRWEEESSKSEGLALWIKVSPTVLPHHTLDPFMSASVLHSAEWIFTPSFSLTRSQPPYISPVLPPSSHPHSLQWKASVRDKFCSNPASPSLTPPVALSLSCLVVRIAVFECLQQCRGCWTSLPWKWRRRERDGGS